MRRRGPTYLKNSLLFLSIGAILALLIVAGFLFLPKEEPMPQVQSPTPSPSDMDHGISLPTPAPTAQLSPQPTPTQALEGWKTYRNEEYGFEIKYPPNYDVKYLQDPEEFIISYYNKEILREIGISIGIKEQFPRGVTGGAEGVEYSSKEEKISFGNVAAVKHTALANGEPYSISIRDFQGIKNIKWGKDAEIFFMGFGDNLDTEEYIKFHEGILATLRFLD